MAVLRTSDIVDLGLYAIRYDAKEPQIVTNSPTATTYHEVFPQGVYLLGVSGSTYLGDDTVAGEISDRWHMPLLSSGLAAVPVDSLTGLLAQPVGLPVGQPVATNNAVGQSLQALVSFERQFRPGLLWNAAVVDAEFAVTDPLGVETKPQSRMPGTTKLAAAAEVVFTPMYFQVVPGLDLTPQVGVQLGLSGRSTIDPGIVAGTGNVTRSVSATFPTVWEAGISYTHFIGSPRLQPLADRDFVIASVSRTF